LQRDALTEAGCTKIFTEQMSGAVVSVIAQSEGVRGRLSEGLPACACRTL
jgi:hypothetical protein